MKGAVRGTRLVPPSAVVLVTVLLAACGGGGKKAAQTTSAPGPTTTTEAPGSPTVRIDYVDFAYSVSGPLVAGGTLQVRNAGKQIHMMDMGRLKPGKTLADVREALAKGGPGGPGGGPDQASTTTSGGRSTSTSGRAGVTASTARGATTTTAAGGGGGGGEQNPLSDVAEEIGFPSNVMGPNQSAEVTAPSLKPGKYALICFIRNEGDGAPHFTKGMINELDVVAGPAPAPPTADATYQVTAGQPIKGPATLTAGRHTLKWQAAPGSDQLEPTVAKLNPGKTFDQLDQAGSKLFEGAKPPPTNAAASLPGELTFVGFDLHDVTSFYLTLDFKPGTYGFSAADTDPENRPHPPKELLNVRVT